MTVLLDRRTARTSSRLAGWAIMLACLGSASAVYGVVPRPNCFEGTCFEEQQEEPKCSYGPCCCEPRKTLLQWSYGASFSGGSDPDEPLVSDRPDFTEASVTVGQGVLQIEMGYTYTTDRDGGVTARSHSYPETLFRYGVFAEWLELRLGQNFASEEAAGLSRSGGEDLYLGAKIALTPQEFLLPQTAIVPQMTVPTGNGDFSAGEVLPGVNFLYSWDLTESTSLSGSTQFNRAIDDGTAAAYTEWAQSFSVGYSLTDNLGAYTEWFAFFPHSADSALPQHYCNAGFTYLISDNVQWDIRAGLGLNDAADDFFVGTGLSIRLK